MNHNYGCCRLACSRRTLYVTETDLDSDCRPRECLLLVWIEVVEVLDISGVALANCDSDTLPHTLILQTAVNKFHRNYLCLY